MKHHRATWLIPRPAVAAAAFVIAVLSGPLVDAVQLLKDDAHTNPPAVIKAIQLMESLERNLMTDGKVEQQSYDKFMCWCEDVLRRKTKDIAEAKDTLASLEHLIPKTRAEVAAHSAEVAQLKKDVVANRQAQLEASEVRERENSAYAGAKADSEASIGALEAAISAMTGAGTKKGFLQTIRQAELISAAEGVGRVLDRDSQTVSSEDMETLRRFVDQPMDFALGNDKRASALQLATGSQRNNPFRDYAPQSSQIQGILKSLYDGFVVGMERDHGAEADKQNSFEELMATKAKELGDSQLMLEQHETEKARKAKLLADSKMEQDITEEQLKADTAFFQETKKGCQRKSQEWNERSGLRAEELLGIGEALTILRDLDDQMTPNSTLTLVQLSSTSVAIRGTSRVLQQQQRQRRARAAARAHRMYRRLSALARKLHSSALAQVAAQTRLGGRFDDVMATIDQRIADLRKEEQDDIGHRDRCERAKADSENDIEDLTHGSDKAQDEINRLDSLIRTLDQRVSDAEGEMHQTGIELAEITKLRNSNEKEFKRRLEEDTRSVQAMKQAVSAVAKFYKKNNLAMSLLEAAQEPEYTVDKDKAPETIYDSEEYGGRQTQTKHLFSALETVIADLEQEIADAKAENTEAQAQYQVEKADLQEVLDKAEEAKVEAENRVAELQEKKVDQDDQKAQIGLELDAEKGQERTLSVDCTWVETHFQSRKTARQAEVDGLQEAKSLLAGAEKGDFDELSLSSDFPED